MVGSGNFQMYDYGSSKKNREHYGQKNPPLYYLSNYTVPTVLFHAGNDWLADLKVLTSNMANHLQLLLMVKGNSYTVILLYILCIFIFNVFSSCRTIKLLCQSYPILKDRCLWMSGTI